MHTVVSNYYISELTNWKESIDVFLEEKNDMSEWLTQILQSNTVPKLAAQVEHHASQLMICDQLAIGLDAEIDQLETLLYKSDVPVNDDLISQDLMDKQSSLRNRMYDAEKKFLEAIYNCRVFLAATIHIQNKLNDGNL